MANSDEILPLNNEITAAIQKLHLDMTSPRAVSTLISHFCIVKGLSSHPAEERKNLRKALKFQINTHVNQKYTSTNSAYGRFL